tara:strand:- start:2436 stop:3269 length:834 start_codon:yes stop_codon:yes gene_type:complete
MLDLIDEIQLKGDGFLKWIGSKKWLKKEILFLISKISPNNYHEPFLGSGAIFFSKKSQKSFLNDINSDLITTYLVVRENPNDLVEKLNELEQSERMFYQIREKKPISNLEIATRFIYLNKTSFNGLYRENKSGEFNASYGKRQFNIRTISNQILSSSNLLQNVELTSVDFSETISNVKENDLVFLDPPYSISEGEGFTRYNRELFSENDQKRIIKYIEEVKKRKAFYILTNEYNDNSVGLLSVLEDKTLIANRKSVISGDINGRKLYRELIVTNIAQ